MLNANLVVQPIGPNGQYGSVSVDLVDGQLVAKVVLSPKAALDAAAKAASAATGSPIPSEIVGFLENAAGLA